MSVYHRLVVNKEITLIQEAYSGVKMKTNSVAIGQGDSTSCSQHSVILWDWAMSGDSRILRTKMEEVHFVNIFPMGLFPICVFHLIPI